MSRHNRNRHGRRVQFERYDPVLTTSPYWVDGLLLDGELRSQSMRTLLETRAPLSSPEDDLRVVIMRNLILLFRLINFYLAFIDRPEFMAVIPIDMGWSQNECINLINRYKRARMKFTPHGRTIPPTADGLSALLCRLVDNYIEAEAVNLQVDWQPRGLFQPASGRLGESCQDRRRSNPRCGTQSPCSASLSGLASHSRRRPRACGGPSEVKIATAPPSRALTAARRGTAEALPIPFAHPTSLDCLLDLVQAQRLDGSRRPESRLRPRLSVEPGRRQRQRSVRLHACTILAVQSGANKCTREADQQ